MNNELLTLLNYLEQERGLTRPVLIKALENALLSASRKSIHPASDIRVKIDPVTGEIRVWAMLEVVESNPNNDQLVIARAHERIPDAKIGDIVEWEVTPRNFGRIAAQTGRQAIMQQLRMAEKECVREQFADRVGHILNGTVRNFDAGNIIIDFQKAEGVLPSREKIAGEQYMTGDRINALLLKIDTQCAGPSLIVSRTHPDFVARLFEREVSEIKDGVVKIMGISREAGSRSKIAVMSTDSRVDPVGSCVGIRGLRVRNIMTELNGERIDIIPWDEDIRKFAANALQPAKVQSVEVNEEKHELVVTVAPDQSKLAFGKKAQNVRLSSKLIGWNISIQTEQQPKGETMAEKIAKASAELAEAIGVSEQTANLLVHNGYLSIDGLKAAGRDQILEISGINEAEINAAFDRLTD